jgi:hypothetical protein
MHYKFVKKKFGRIRDTLLCIDEQMIPFKGSLNIKQYIKNQPTKWGIKASTLVTTLAERITEPNYNVLQYLRDKFVYASCTARIDRFANPPFSSDKIMKEKGRGSSEEVVSKDGIVMVKWFKNKMW